MTSGNVWHLRGKDGEVLTMSGVAIDKGAIDRLTGGTLVLDDESCWNWDRFINRGGYGTTFIARPSPLRSLTVVAHRLSWILANQSNIPDGQMVLHCCDNRRCVNPHHLRIGTAKDNTRDAIERGRRAVQNGRQIKGEGNPNAKLTSDDILSIVEKYEAGGVTYVGLSKEYGVNRATIGQIVRRDSWKHIHSTPSGSCTESC